MLSTMFLIHKCVFHFHRIWATRGKKPWTLGYILVLQTMSSPLNCFLVWTNWCSLQNDAMYTKSWFVLVLDPSVKALGPIKNSWPIGMLGFIGPCSLDLCLKWHLDWFPSWNYVCLVHYKKMYYNIMWHIYI